MNYGLKQFLKVSACYSSTTFFIPFSFLQYLYKKLCTMFLCVSGKVILQMDRFQIICKFTSPLKPIQSQNICYMTFIVFCTS